MKLRLTSAGAIVAAFLLAVGCSQVSTGAAGSPSPVSQSTANSAPGGSAGQTADRRCPGPPASAAGPTAGQPATPRLTGVQFVSPSIGWAVGSDRILRTIDSGRHWARQYSATPKARLASVDFVDASHGWVIGATSLLATTDGGAHWTSLPEPCLVLRSVHFISPAAGFAVAGGAAPYLGVPPSGGSLLHTTDGGQTWRVLATPANVQSACFSDASRGWLGVSGDIYGTTDGGRTWARAVKGPAHSGQPGGGATAEVQCAASGAAWAVLVGPGAGMNQQSHIGYHTAGSTWRPIFAEQYFRPAGLNVRANSPGPEAGPFSTIGPDEAVFIDWCGPCSPPGNPQYQGMAPLDIATAGGATLLARGPVSQLTQATGAAFVSVSDGWVVGTQTSYPASGGSPTSVSRIMHTTDGGRTWQAQYVLNS